jgi:glycopeptide antibiotics resistance protein
MIYLVLAIITMLLGLASRSSLITLPELLNAYVGDTLWALMVFWLFRTLHPSAPVLHSFAFAICFSFSIEFSQFYHASWIDSIRSTQLGGLVLGFGFKLSDLICYLIGIGIGFILNKLLITYGPKRYV